MVDRDAVRRGYDDLAETYAAGRSEGECERTALAELLEAVSSPARLLDVGCGQGTPVLRRLSGAGAAVGADFSRRQLALAAENVPEAALVRSDMTALPFRADAFDAVTATHSLIHVPLEEHRTVLEEFARVLRPGGRVLLTEGVDEWRGTNPDWLETGVEMQWHIAGIAATRDHLRTAGFTVVNERRTTEEDAEADEQWVFVVARLDG